MAEQQYTAQQVIDAIKDSGGNMSIVAKRLGCDRSTVARYAQRYVTIREALQQADEAVTDLAESKAIKLINEEYWPAIMHRLNTKGKARGYSERKELTGADGGPQEIVFKVVYGDDGNSDKTP